MSEQKSQSEAMAEETDRFFREMVLCLGGIFAVHEVDDDLVWQVTKSLDRIYQRTRARLLERGASKIPPAMSVEPHPAVVGLLTRIGGEHA